MIVRFWGTRGSLPVADRGFAVSAPKSAKHCSRRSGHKLDKRQRRSKSLMTSIFPFSIGGSYGGNSELRRDRNRRRRVRALRSRQRSCVSSATMY